MSPAILQLAILDFNIVQAIYQEELKCTSRWDPKTIDNLPDYMRICFLALYNCVNELGHEILKENGCYITPYLKEAWTDLCKSYFTEAKWYYNGYTPSLEEYMKNAWISISAPVVLTHAYFLVSPSFINEDFVYLKEHSNIIHFSAMILRIANDLGTYKVFSICHSY
ncbi:unnamed protein product [Lupinus luteus]|uniref:Terpene synthase metal-binding domain-containing protein n=1 Tax=Lupinus luteus TaxID=3873 RepID=A0AAV1XJ04_LUPLU